MIKLNNFSKAYGDFYAVKNISFELKRASVLGFVGKNGAGKSTTLRAIMDILKPTSGTIEVSGMDSVKDAKKIKKIVSYMPSEVSYYTNLAVKDFIAFNLKFCDSTMDEAMKWAEYFELETGKKLSELSLGNKKKVSIVSMLIKDSDIYVMDEPTSGLDPLIQKKFFKVILDLKNQGKSVLLSSHNLNEVEKYCDEVIIIKDGEIVDLIDMSSVSIKHNLLVSYTSFDGEKIDKEFDGDVNDLIKELSLLNLKTIEIKPKSIEDEFIGFYEKGAVNKGVVNKGAVNNE